MQRLSRRVRLALKIAVTTVVVGVAGYFFGRTLVANWGQVRDLELSPDWRMAVAVALFIAAVPFTGLLWASIVNRLQSQVRVGPLEGIAVQSASWLLKYVPGQLGSLAYKLTWGVRRAVPRSIVGLSFIYENVFLVLAGTVPPVLLLAFVVPFDRVAGSLELVALPVLAVLPLIVLALPSVLSRLVTVPARRLLKEDLPRSSFLSARDAVMAQLWFVGPRVLNGIGYVFVVESVAPVDPSAWLPLAAAYVLACAAGLLAIFVPSGIGVREAVIVLFAALYLPLPVAIVTSLVARLLSTLGDVGVAVIHAATRPALSKAAT